MLEPLLESHSGGAQSGERAGRAEPLLGDSRFQGGVRGGGEIKRRGQRRKCSRHGDAGTGTDPEW